MASNIPMSPQLEQIHGEIRYHFRALANGFQRLDKVKDSTRQNKQLEELTEKMRDCKRYMSTLGNKKIELFDMGAGPSTNLHLKKMFKWLQNGGYYVTLCIAMSNQELVDAGMKRMDETDQAIQRSKQVVEQTIEVGTQSAANLKGYVMQNTIQFSLKKASQLVKEIGRQVATDKFIMMFLFLIVCGVIAIIIVKVLPLLIPVKVVITHWKVVTLVV
ncbi:hypothetical protein Bca4012_063584 [Brassica carinata]